MAINVKYPSVGKNQPSQGFRDNWTDIDGQFTQIRSKQIRFESGDLSGTSQVIGSGAGEILFTAQIRDNPELSGAESMLIPQGITAQRPSTPQRGQFRFNQTIIAFEGYNGSTWVTLSGTGGSLSAEDEGSDLGVSVNTLNFVGPGILATDAGGGKVNVTVSGGGGGGGAVLFVNDIPARDLLTTTGGEQVLVLNDAITADGIPGEGEWAMFLRNQTNTAWFEVGTERRGDADHVESITIEFQFDDGALQNIGVVPAGKRVVKVSVLVSVPWDTAATLVIGTIASPSLLMLADENDLQGVFIYEVDPGLGAVLVNTGIRASYSANGIPTLGTVRVTIAYA